MESFQRCWDEQGEVWFLPWRVGSDTTPQRDDSRTIRRER